MKDEQYKAIISNLREAIQESGLKQKAVAERVNMHPRQLNNVLCYRKRLNPEDIPAFCMVLNITPNQLFKGTVA